MRILPPGEIDVHSSLGRIVTISNDKWVEYSVHGPVTAGSVFNLMLCTSKAVDEQQELFSCVYQLSATILSPEKHI